MAYYDYDPTLDFDAQEQEMLQQAARIKALRGANLKTEIDQPQGYTSAVTGAKMLAPTVKRPLLSSLTPLLQDYTADQMERDLSKQRSKVSTAQQDEMQKWISGTPQAIPAQPGIAPLTPNDDEGNAMPVPQEPVAAQPVTRQQVLTHAMAGMKNPLTKTLAGNYMSDQLIKEPEREEARQERLFTKAQAAAESRRKQAEDLAYKRERDAEMMEFRRAQQEQNAELRRESLAARAEARSAQQAAAAGDKPNAYQIIEDKDGNYQQVHKVTKKVTPLLNDDGTPMQGVKGAEKPMPTGEQAKYSTNKASIKSIDEVLADKNDGGTGFFKGYAGKIPIVGDKIVQGWNTKSEQERLTAINRLSAVEVHRLYGSAQTLGEVARAGGFLPLPTDNAEQVANKLGQMKKFIERENKAIEDMAAAQKYRSPASGGGGGKGGDGEWTVTPKAR